MNKTLILREKYPKISQQIFDHFLTSDNTPTKKYFPYMLKLWSNKKGATFLSNRLTDVVKSFDELLPYIENKDIYSTYYETFSNLVLTVEKAKELKEEKSFKREENVTILYENDDFLFLAPKTYRGSLKYGSSTKWCTASKTTDSYYNNYTNKGSLCYLLDKKGDKIGGASKLGFYVDNNGNELQVNFKIYNENDNEVDINNLIKNKWTLNDLTLITTLFRSYASNNNIIKKIEKSVKTTLDLMKNIDLNVLMNNIKFLEKTNNVNIYTDSQDIINNFILKLKEYS
jgi:hypothetical protein